MSNLNSVFDTLRGWPNGSSLELSFQPKKGVTLTEGQVASGVNRQLADATVLKMVDDTLVTSPTLAYADKGKAYMVAGAGGDWSGFAVGDIVEWNGSAWAVAVGHVANEPPDGTRVVVVDASAAGSFAGEEKEVWSYATAGSTWSSADVPADGERVYLTAGVYSGEYYDYFGTHPAGGWRKAAAQERARAVMDAYSSIGWDGNRKGDAWLVIQGNDQYDAAFVNKVTCLKLSSGCTFKVQNDNADSLVAGTFVEAASGAIQALTDKWPVGVVVWSNGVSGSGGQIAIASM
jgi:hypothetical protein